MAVTVLDDTNFAHELAKADNAVVDFYAGWCGPCLMFKPIFARVSADYPHVHFFMLDGGRAPVSRKTVQIDNLPFFGAYRNGALLEGTSLSVEDKFRAFIEKNFGSAP
jgi:thioredoxin 1